VLSRLPRPAHPEHHFVFDASKLSFYAATCYAWLGETDRAEEHAREVIAQSVDRAGTVRWPTRLAVARIDLGLVATQRGQLDEAAGFGIAALGSGRVVASTLEWFADLDTALDGNHSDVAEVQEFHQRYRATRLAIEQGAAP
jgi:hypothetical protein